MFNLDHKRALAAFNMVELFEKMTTKDKAVQIGGIVVDGAAQGDPKATKKRFLQEVRATPVLIHQAGLLQTLAFYDAKAQARRLVRLCILHWLRHYTGGQQAPDLQANSPREANEFYKSLLTAASKEEDLMSMTAETQAFLVWLKNFSEAHFGD